MGRALRRSADRGRGWDLDEDEANSRFPSEMTERKAKAKAKTTADSLRE